MEGGVPFLGGRITGDGRGAPNRGVGSGGVEGGVPFLGGGIIGDGRGTPNRGAGGGVPFRRGGGIGARAGGGRIGDGSGAPNLGAGRGGVEGGAPF